MNLNDLNLQALIGGLSNQNRKGLDAIANLDMLSKAIKWDDENEMTTEDITERIDSVIDELKEIFATHGNA